MDRSKQRIYVHPVHGLFAEIHASAQSPFIDDIMARIGAAQEQNQLPR